MAISYVLPKQWIAYDALRIFQPLVDAKSVVEALKTTPFQRDWVHDLQRLQLKMEVSGTSRIEGAEFSEQELDDALSTDASALFTRSQRQAKAAADTYRWIAEIPDDRAVNVDLVREIHRRMVTGCDDDQCKPGGIRTRDHNVTFGIPKHRGCEGGEPCAQALESLVHALNHEFRDHDPLLQAMGLHYHFAAIHPFGDGNGRTARALEALLLQRSGLRDTAFVAMSNYYYEEKQSYLTVMTEVCEQSHDLTAFFRFGLVGVASQCRRLLGSVKNNIQKAVFRNTMYDLFGKLLSPKKRAVGKRQVEVLKLFLDRDSMTWEQVRRGAMSLYDGLKNPRRALDRDLWMLLVLRALTLNEVDNSQVLRLNLEWPEEIDERVFLQRIRELPKAKSYQFLQPPPAR